MPLDSGLVGQGEGKHLKVSSKTNKQSTKGREGGGLFIGVETDFAKILNDQRFT